MNTQLPYIEQIPFSERLSFEQKVRATAVEVGTSPEWLMTVMHFETAGSLSPAETNSLGYTGLIQFGTSAATELGTTTNNLRSMSHTQQMDYVRNYLKIVKSRYNADYTIFENLYLAVFYPAALNWGPNQKFPAAVASANPSFRDASGNITKSSIKARFDYLYPAINATKQYDTATEEYKEPPAANVILVVFIVLMIILLVLVTILFTI